MDQELTDGGAEAKVGADRSAPGVPGGESTLGSPGWSRDGDDR